MRMLLAAALMAVLSWPARAEPPVFVAAALAPYVFVDGTAVKGPAIDLARALAAGAGLEPQIQAMPVARMLDEARDGNHIIVDLARTPEREDKFTWIAEIADDAFVFATRAPAPPINSLDEAKGLAKIAATNAGAPAMFLGAHGIAGVNPANSEVTAAKLLATQRVDAWFTAKQIARFSWKQAGEEPSTLVIGNPVLRTPFWIFATKDVAPDLIAKMQERYAAMKASGEYQKIVAPLL